MKTLVKEFFTKRPDKVAKDLLGKLLLRKLENKFLIGEIVETEAYFGEKDPASRAYLGKPKYCVKLMKDEPGKILIYNVHNNWLLNVVAHEKGKTGAVLIRAIEPIKGIEEMKKNRITKNFFDLTRGPGKLSKAFAIDKSLNGIDSTNEESPINFLDVGKEDFEVACSHRIGVKKDLAKPLRFFIKGSKFVSR
ncbi:MAG: DNA-3-methyladenine glycosylase [Candidatus Aenigmatarchaeota archaeon]